MTNPTTEAIVNDFTSRLTQRLNPDMIDAPVRLDNTRTVAIISVKGRGLIHAHVHGGVNESGLANVLEQIQIVPSLKGLVLPA